MAVVLTVIGALAVFVAALLALDWFMAGRKGRRMLRSAADGEAGNANAGYADVERGLAAIQRKEGESGQG
jgi:hypothetical protein